MKGFSGLGNFMCNPVNPLIGGIGVLTTFATQLQSELAQKKAG